MRPVIAMPQMGHEVIRKYMKSKYVLSLIRAGAAVRWIEIDDPQKAVEEALLCDGLLLPGGADVEPSMYGAERLPECGEPHILRDKAEPMLFEAFKKQKKPILCICRGVQMLNVCMGGTLKQDITFEQREKHSDFDTRGRGCHYVDIKEGSKLHEILGKDRLFVNSMHHQAADIVGEGLEVTAKSDDGYVEALEMNDYPFGIGVQWHPEHMTGMYEDQRKLFTAFVKACKK